MKHALPALLFILNALDAGVCLLGRMLDRHRSLSLLCNLLACGLMVWRALMNLPGNPPAGWLYFTIAVLAFGFACMDGLGLLIAGFDLVIRLRRQARARRVASLIRYFTPATH